MKKSYKKKDENLSEWCERLAKIYRGGSIEDLCEILVGVSKESYIEGVNAEREISKRYGV